VKGLENLDRKNLNKPGGILFLPNHPAVLVDPVLVSVHAWRKVPLRPIIVEYMYNLPVVNFVMRHIDALPMPDFESSMNTVKRKQGEVAMSEMINGLKRGESFLIYPAGRLKKSSKEDIGGASGTHQIIHNAPEANVVLVRTKGLYGSMFSSALTGRTPPLFPTLLQGIKVVLKNLLFFTPRRKVIIEFHPAPQDFPYNASRLELNRWLEKWYNQPDGLTKQEGEYPGDSLILVSYAFWKEELPELYKPKAIKEELVQLGDVNETVQAKVIAKLQELTEIDAGSIKPEMSLASDLGLDSLDTSELATFLQEQFDTGPIPVTELTTVSRVLGFASKKIKIEKEQNEDKADVSKWYVKVPRKRAQIADGNTIAEVFLNSCERMGHAPACADLRSGIFDYSRLKLSTIILAERIRKFPGKYIGILLPASVGAYLAVLACQLAGKVPVMINWTIGPRHLQAVRELSGIQVVLSSWAFIERLDNTDLTGIDDIMIMLENVRKEFTLLDKIKGKMRSLFGTKTLLRTFGIDQISKDDQAVLLFTSGTESMPKGVPLSHENILSNARQAFTSIDLYTDDVMLGILPPFHAFGFTTSGLMGLLSGLRSAYYPNPIDGPGISKAFHTWGATLICGAPSFLKVILKAATPEQVKTMRICVTGAEKAPPELFLLMAQIGKEHALIEGYGVTECAPILTANRPGKPRKGVGSPLIGVEICIVHPETHEFLPTGSQGLVLARGSNIFNGYLNPGVESPFITLNGKKWYNTGDIGFLDEEHRLTLSGRKKRFIKIGGEMISLLAIESELLLAAPLKGWPIKEEGPTLALLAKEREGEKPYLILITTFEINVEEINNTLKERGFSNLIRISDVMKLEEIPIMGTGKVNYRLLEERYLQGAAETNMK
jgi:long-chain-fatty-acid--[acyl-carrier-protein] ligase